MFILILGVNDRTRLRDPVFDNNKSSSFAVGVIYTFHILSRLALVYGDIYS